MSTSRSGEIDVVGVAWNGRDDDYTAFVDRHGLTFPQIADTDGVIFDRFGIPFQPAYALVTTSGDVELLIGSASAATLGMIIDDALGR